MNKEQEIILLCEDDANYGLLLCDYLRRQQYRVDYAQDGEEGWQMFNNNHYDFCIFDVMMPVRNGFELAKAIRLTGSQVPILFLTARSAVEDILEGYRSGADDYVLKPCAMDVLVCKIECILARFRRQQQPATTRYTLGSFVYDSAGQTLTKGSILRNLSSKENDVLALLAQNINRLVEKKLLLTSVWHDDSYFANRSLNVYINHLRTLLKEDDAVRIINEHGKGYKLVVMQQETDNH